MFAGQLWKILSSRRSLSSLVSTLVCDCRHNDFINHLPYLIQLWYCLWVHVQCFFLNCCAWAVALHQFTSKPYTFVCSALAASDNNLPPFLLPASAVNLTSQLSPEPSLVPHLVLISHLPSATWNGRAGAAMVPLPVQGQIWGPRLQVMGTLWGVARVFEASLPSESCLSHHRNDGSSTYIPP